MPLWELLAGGDSVLSRYSLQATSGNQRGRVRGRLQKYRTGVAG